MRVSYKPKTMRRQQTGEIENGDIGMTMRASPPLGIVVWNAVEIHHHEDTETAAGHLGLMTGIVVDMKMTEAVRETAAVIETGVTATTRIGQVAEMIISLQGETEILLETMIETEIGITAQAVTAERKMPAETVIDTRTLRVVASEGNNRLFLDMRYIQGLCTLLYKIIQDFKYTQLRRYFKLSNFILQMTKFAFQ
jgi:hypothetical protein